MCLGGGRDRRVHCVCGREEEGVHRLSVCVCT